MQIKRILLIAIISIIFNTIICAYIFSPLVYQQYTFTLMIDPAGDAQTPGRTIQDCFERSITLQFAQQLKQLLENRYPGLRCIITRSAGEIIAPLQNANYANRANVDLFLSINFYEETRAKPNLYIYTFSYNDTFIARKSDITFYTYDQIHQYNAEQTKRLSDCIKQSLESTQQFNCIGALAIPFKPLIGIKASAIAFEIGIKTKDDWQKLLEPIATSLNSIIEQNIA